MKNSTLTSLYAYICQNDSTIDVTTLASEIEAEYQRVFAKRDAANAVYEKALEIVRGFLSDTPQTGAELFAACVDSLPEDFTRGKFNYLLRKYPEVFVGHDNGKNPKTYTKS